MAYKRKTQDLWDIEGYYSRETGWECVTSEEDWKEARERVKEYRENEPGIPFRVTLHRYRIEYQSIPATV